MIYSENFLNELRTTVKGMLLKGDVAEICKVKELLEYSNTSFGDFIAPMLKDDCSVSENLNADFEDDLVAIDTETSGNSFEARSLDGKHTFVSNKVTTMTADVHPHGDDTPSVLSVFNSEEPKESTYKYMPYFNNLSTPGKLEGVVIYKLRAFIIEDLETGKMLYKHTHYIARMLNLKHGDVVSFNVGEENKLIDITIEGHHDFNDGIQIVTNCPVLEDGDGFYVPTDMLGNSLTEYGSPVSPYNIPYNVVDAFGIQEDDSVDLYIQPHSIPYVMYVNRGYYKSMEASALTSGINLAAKSLKGAIKSASKTYQKYDFDLKGKSVGFIGVPPSNKVRVESLCKEKGAESYEFIDSSNHTETVSIPQRFADLDIVVLVKRFVGHGTVYQLKSLLKDSDTALINTSSHSVDAIERALYCGANGYPSEEGTVTVNYPLLKD